MNHEARETTIRNSNKARQIAKEHGWCSSRDVWLVVQARYEQTFASYSELLENLHDWILQGGELETW